VSPCSQRSSSSCPRSEDVILSTIATKPSSSICSLATLALLELALVESDFRDLLLSL
jgi:hypothetical protein